MEYIAIYKNSSIDVNFGLTLKLPIHLRIFLPID